MGRWRAPESIPTALVQSSSGELLLQSSCLPPPMGDTWTCGSINQECKCCHQTSAFTTSDTAVGAMMFSWTCACVLVLVCLCACVMMLSSTCAASTSAFPPPSPPGSWPGIWKQGRHSRWCRVELWVKTNIPGKDQNPAAAAKIWLFEQLHPHSLLAMFT